MADKDDRKLKPVRGSKRVPKRQLETFAPSDGWDAAIADAVRKINWPIGRHPGNVEFHVTVEVTNPGKIVAYSVTITPGG
jgi:hypothetical protein